MPRVYLQQTAKKIRFLVKSESKVQFLFRLGPFLNYVTQLKDLRKCYGKGIEGEKNLKIV